LRGDGLLPLGDGEQPLGKARRTFERLGEPSDADDIDAYAHDHGASLAYAGTTVASLTAGEVSQAVYLTVVLNWRCQ
jgi:hypothetical protein